MRGMWAIAAKDLRQRLRDRSAYLIGILAPLALALLFGISQDRSFESEYDMLFALVDEDRGAHAAAFGEVVASLDGAGVAETMVLGRASAESKIDDGSLTAAFVVPAGFSAAVDEGEPAEILVIGHPDAQHKVAIAESIANGFVRQLSSAQLAVATAETITRTPPTPDESAARRATAATTPEPATLMPVEASGRGVDLATYTAIGMAVFFLFFTIQFGVLGLIEERRLGTMGRLVAAPIRPAAILGGKALATFLVGLTAMAAVVVGTTYLPLEADWGDPAGVAVVAIVCVLCVMGILALIGSVARTRDQAVNLVTVVAVVFGLLGGAFFPVALAGGFLEYLSRFTPHRWMIEGFRRLAAGDSIADIVPVLGIVLVIGVVTGAMGLARFRKEVTSA